MTFGTYINRSLIKRGKVRDLNGYIQYPVTRIIVGIVDDKVNEGGFRNIGQDFLALF